MAKKKKARVLEQLWESYREALDVEQQAKDVSEWHRDCLSFEAKPGMSGTGLHAEWVPGRHLVLHQSSMDLEVAMAFKDWLVFMLTE